MTFRVLSQDPGSRFAGVCVVERDGAIWHARMLVSIGPRDNEDACGRLARIFDAYDQAGEVHCVCSEQQTHVSIGAQKAGQVQVIGNLRVHEVVGAARREAHRRRVPFVELPTATVMRRVTGSGKWRGKGKGVDYQLLGRALRAQVRGIPDRVSQHVLMAIAVGIAGARADGGRGSA